jgi:2-dehydro-3-deoxygluconokinase
MSEVVLFGEAMALLVAKTTGDLASAEEYERLMSGAEVNVAIGLKRLGHSVSYITKLGTDPWGVYIERRLKEEGIDTQLTFDAEHWTGFQLKQKVQKGDPEVYSFRRNSAASHLSEEDVDKVNMEGARLLHLTGIPPALSQSCRNATFRLIERARENHMLVSFDPNLREYLWESPRAMIRIINYIASLSDIVLPGVKEGKILMNSSDPAEIAAFYRKQGAKTVIVKNGARGAYVDSEEGKFSFPGYQIDHVVDTVGAGDGFAVGVLSGYLEGCSLAEMIDRGNAIGAIQVTFKGDNEGLPTHEQLDTFRRTHAKVTG